MHDESIISEPVRLSRTLILAGILAAVGLLRLGSDLLTDIDPSWASWLDGSPLRYLVIRVSDGSLAGNLTMQYFKVLAIPCGLSVVFLLNAGLTGGVQAAARRWADARFRLFVIAALAALCTFCEIEKAMHLLGLPTGLVQGERAWLNHAVHAVGGVVPYGLSRVLRYTPTDAATAESIDQPSCPGAPTRGQPGR
jgi:hypothetical protein